MASNVSLYLLVVLLGATSCRSQLPTITIRLTANATNAGGLVGLHEGDSLMLTCEVQNLNGMVIVWIFKETTRIMPNTNPAKYQVTANGSISTLTILNLIRVQDAGGYSCAVYQSEEFSEPQVRESLEILVYYFPDDMYPICHGPVIITEGEPVTFRCESELGERPVDLAWRRDSGTIQETISNGEGNGKKFAEYTFVPRKDYIGITAYCTISSNAIFRGKTSTCSVGPLSVQYPPTNISITNQNVSYSNSSYDAILCNASAVPTNISYTWSFNTNLDSSQQVLINGNQTLVILNVIFCEFPIIATCQAANDIGNITANYTLCEPPPLPNPVCYPKNQVVLTEGVPEMFQCVSYFDDDNSADVVWSRDKRLISTDSITTGDLPNNYKYSNYTFVPTRDDFGINVTCSLRSGTRFPDYCIIGPLSIQYIPSDAAISNDTYLYDNVTYQAFSCKSSAFPSNVSYSWNFNTPVSSSQHMLTNDNQTLVILNITTCETLIIATCQATNDVGKHSVNVTLCEPPPPLPLPLPSSTRPTMTSLTSKLITSNGLPSTGLPITTSDQAATTPQPLPLTRALYIVIIGAGILLLIILISICYFALISPDKDSGEMDMHETNKEMGQHKSINVQLKRDSRILADSSKRRSILYFEEGIPEDAAVDNPGFHMKTFNQEEGDNNIPQEQSHHFYENSIYPLEELTENMSPNNPDEEGQIQTQDSSNNTDFENDNKIPASDPKEVENEDDGSQEKDKSDANQGQDNSLDKPASDVEAVDDENFTDDGNQESTQPDEENSDPEHPSSEPKDEDDQVDDTEANDADDIEDDEKMVDPPTIEVETEMNPDDPRKSIVHEALLAVQVSDPGSPIKKPEMAL